MEADLTVQARKGELWCWAPTQRLKSVFGCVACEPDASELCSKLNSNTFPGAPVIGANGVIYVAGGSTNKVFAIGVPEPTTMLLAMIVLTVRATRRHKSVPRNRV